LIQHRIQRFERGPIGADRDPSERATSQILSAYCARRGGGPISISNDTGRDPEFGSGSTVYQNHNGDVSAGGVNRNLGSLFYALRLYPSDIGTSAGLVTYDTARVLDTGNRPIPRLYACATTCSPSWAEPILARGITLGPALAFAFVAASDAVGRR
jgi:FAD binding domain